MTWNEFIQSSEYHEIVAVLPKNLTQYHLGSYAPTDLQDEPIILALVMAEERYMKEIYQEWLTSPVNSYWYNYIEINVSSVDDPRFDEAKVKSQELLANQHELVENQLKIVQDLERFPRLKPLFLLKDSFFGGWEHLKPFFPQNSQQVYAMYRLRHVWALSRRDEFREDLPNELVGRLSWEEIARRIEIAHGIYTDLYGSEKPSW